MGFSRSISDAPPDAMGPPDSALLFSRGTIRLTHIIATVIGLGLYTCSIFRHSALLAPINPNFHAVAIGCGVFAGFLLAAVEHEGWKVGLCTARDKQAPRGMGALIGMVAIIGASGFGGSYLARVATEIAAFHGLAPATQETSFTVTGWHSGRGSSHYLEVSATPGGRTITLSADYDAYHQAKKGDHLDLPVQTGRWGIQRAVIPWRAIHLEDLHSY